MIFTRHDTGDELIIEIEGQLSGDETERIFQKELRALEKTSHPIITFNLTRVNAINSANIGKFFLFMNRLKAHGRTLQIRGCSDTLYQTFQLIRLEDFLPVEKNATVN